MVLMRRRDVKLTVDELMRPSTDECEWISMRHNLQQVQREVEGERGALQAERERLRGVKESLSWRSTQWIRRLKFTVRSRG